MIFFRGLKPPEVRRCSKCWFSAAFFLVQECKREGNFKFQEGLYEEVSFFRFQLDVLDRFGRARSVVGLTYLQPSWRRDEEMEGPFRIFWSCLGAKVVSRCSSCPRFQFCRWISSWKMKQSGSKTTILLASSLPGMMWWDGIGWEIQEGQQFFGMEKELHDVRVKKAALHRALRS